jgi:hypothetical protein
MANEQTRGTTDFATQNTDSGTDIKGRAREAVSQAKERAGERIESRITDSKTRAAETLSGVASTLLSSSEQLRGQNQAGASRAIERAAEGVERFANYLQDTDVDDVVEQVHEFARRQPAAFIGGAFALGFIASRFLKASSPYGSRRLPAPSDYGRGYGASYETSRSHEGYEGSLGDSTGSMAGDRGSISRTGGYGNTGDTSGSLGYGAGLSTTGGGTTGGGYSTGGATTGGSTTGGATTGGGYSTTGTVRNTDDLGDGSPGLGGAGTTGASRTGNTANRSGNAGGSNAGSR